MGLINDGHCDEECYNSANSWDGEDCLYQKFSYGDDPYELELITANTKVADP